MKINEDYITEEFSVIIPVADFMAQYRDAEKFMGFCKQCRRYDTCWACPPFSFNVDHYLDQYQTAFILASKITPLHPQEITDPITYGAELMKTERLSMDARLLKLEKQYQGRAFFAGFCIVCPSCTRIEGKPCPYPELARPSLESCGFDIGKTTSQLLNIELKWSENGKMPEYLTLVGGVFHNAIQ